MERFGQLLRQYRVAAGFSQEHVAEEARLSVASISALERGLRQAPYRHTVQRIVKALGLDAARANELEVAADIARRRRPLRPDTPNESGNLPAPTFPLVGRVADVANIARLVEPNRLVTINGTGGVGKTRVAIEVAADVGRALGPPVFVDLAAAVSGSTICNAIASAIEDPSTIEHLDAQALARRLGARRLLIVLDTCEHVLADVAKTVVAILRRCPRVAMLATSRERLGVSGEAVYRLAPLTVPAGRVADLREAHRYASLDLFIRRAMSAEHGVCFTDENAEAVAAICRVLDGIPLLIERAAARVGALGVQALAARLQEGLEPGNVSRDVPPRHQTSLSSIDWSYRLLTKDEKEIFTHLAVFPGAFTLAEVETVCAADGRDETAISDVLAALVEKNLVEVEATGTATYHRMLNMVRRFASSRHMDAVDAT
jgi:predicted ATPase/transcriptional regulator with XRE-family HTH domain